MSLQIWMPLINNTNNQGLICDEIITNSEATTDTSGKIGKCYSFNGSSSYINIHSDTLKSIFIGGNNPFSIATWVYHGNSKRGVIFGDYSAAQYNSRTTCFNFELTTSHTIRFYWRSAASGGTDKTFSNSSIGANTWAHVTITYDGSKVLCYINGILLEDLISVSLQQKPLTAADFRLGRDNRIETPVILNGKLNDLRIYDHCLSKKEVEEISKGLVLHYKLDLPNPNLILNSLNILIDKLNSADGSRLEYTAINVGLSYMNLTNNQKVTISFDLTLKVGSPNITSFTIYNSNNKGPIAISSVGISSQIAKLTQGTSVGDIVKGKIKSTHTITVRTDANKTDNFIEFYSLYGSNNFYKIENLKMELGEEATSYCINSETIETIYDCSGYNNHGTVNGTLNATTDSPRYDIAILSANGADNYILGSELPSTCLTVSMWIKTTIPTTSTAYKVIFAEGNSDLEIALGQSVFYVATQNSSTSKTGFSNSLFNNDEWNHLVLVKINNTTKKLYINNQEATTSGSDYFRHDAGPFMIFRRNFNTNYSSIDTKISDVRIYTTALSAAAIKELYNTSASIDASGNVYARELKEV